MTSYRIYLGYEDAQSIADQHLKIQSRSTTAVITNSNTTPQKFKYGIKALSFNQKLYFGGGMEVTGGHVPMIGFADPTTLAIEQALSM